MERVALISFATQEAAEIAGRVPFAIQAHETLPRIQVRGGVLFVEEPEGVRFRRVSRVVYHSIFENDLEFLAGLALWGRPCFPNPTGLMNCRLRLPCLVNALRVTRFGGPRGYASPGLDYESDVATVAKWGNWHCGENKEQFLGKFRVEEPTLFEPYVAGEAIRVVILGEVVRQIRMAGLDWRKSVHGEGAELMTPDPELVADTEAIRRGLGLDLIANDYIVAGDHRYLLEVNHIPSVTCFPELWASYLDLIESWAFREGTTLSGVNEPSLGQEPSRGPVARRLHED